MNRIIRMAAVGMVGMAIGLAAARAGTPPPPPGTGGTITPPSTPPPGRIFFEDNVVIVGPGFEKPDSNGGTVFIDITKLTPGTVKPDGGDTGKTVERVVRELSQVKSQVEAGAVAIPPGLLDPAGLLMALFGEQVEEQGLARDPPLLADDAGAPGAAVQAAPGAPVPHQPGKTAPGAAVIPSYWQLPIP